MTDKVEQTEIARTLGISNKKFRQMIEGRAEWTLINHKRHYDMQDVSRVIKQARSKGNNV